MIDRGWRRSGEAHLDINRDAKLCSFHLRFILLQARSQALLLPTIYHQVTRSFPDHWIKSKLYLRLDAMEFKPSRSQRQLLNR